MHTEDPLSKQKLVSIEVAVGLGETLASGNQKGQPYRMTYDPMTKVCDIKTFANYDYSYCSNDAESNNDN